MNKLRIRIMAALLLAFGMAFMALAPKAEEGKSIASSASAMALIECTSGKLISSLNADIKLPMASTTKIMTALVVLENCDPEELVMIPDEAVGIEGSSIYLERGESMKIVDLLYGLMLASGNDAAVALAVHTAGSVNAFVDMMNERAEKLGLKNTHFMTPNGLHHDKHLTTAYELCLIAREAVSNELLRRIVSTKYYETESGNVPRTFKNKNSLLWTYEGAFGVKTGYTMAAGRCLVFGAEREGMTVIGAVLNCRPMFETASELMDMAFEKYACITPVDKTDTFVINVENSCEYHLEVHPKDSIIILMQKGRETSPKVQTQIYWPIEPPVDIGDTVGAVTVYDDGGIIGQTDLVAGSVLSPRGFGYWWDVLVSLFAS